MTAITAHPDPRRHSRPSTMSTRTSASPSSTWSSDVPRPLRDYDATLTADEDGAAAPQRPVPADSIVVKDENLAAHLQSPEFFDAERHPYCASPRADPRRRRRADRRRRPDHQGPHRARSRPRGTIAGPTEDRSATPKLGLELEAIVDRTEFGLNWNAPLPKGGFALANDVTLSVDLELARP